MLVKSGLCKSQSDARNQVKAGAVLVADKKVDDLNATLAESDVPADGLLIQKGQEELPPPVPRMSAMNPYRTLRQSASDEFIINKSRFIGYAAPCETEAEALAFLQSIRTKHKDATHNCYAYIIGQNAGIMRYSDDGEPGGTAGLPMMEVLKHQGVVNCCCVVTRYFGGVLLGAGGLVRAYTQGAVIALKAAQVVEILPSCQYLCEVAYPLWDKVQYALKSLPVQLLSSEFTTAVGFTLLIRQTDAQSVLDTLTRVTDGRIETLLEEESYRAWDSEKQITDFFTRKLF